jgi:hypothetical protein
MNIQCLLTATRYEKGEKGGEGERGRAARHAPGRERNDIFLISVSSRNSWALGSTVKSSKYGEVHSPPRLNPTLTGDKIACSRQRGESPSRQNKYFESSPKYPVVNLSEAWIFARLRFCSRFAASE